MRQTLERAGSEVRRIDQGWMVRTRALPAVRRLNCLHITERLDFKDTVRLAEEHLSGLPYRTVLLEEGSSVEPQARAAGWEVEHDVVMALDRASEPAPPAGTVIEPSEAEMLALMRRWHVEEDKPSPGELDQLVESACLEARAGSERHFGIADSDGRLVAIANLRSDRTIAQVENVYTVGEARRRGYARTLVAHAAALAGGHELTFIEADDDDWPKDLYARLGFRPIGRRSWCYSAA